MTDEERDQLHKQAALVHAAFDGKFPGGGRDPYRISRILDAIRVIWMRDPDQRFMQLLSNAGLFEVAEELGTIKDPYFLEDTLVEEILTTRKSQSTIDQGGQP